MCIYSYMFKLQSPSKHSPFDAMQLLRLFHCSKQFLNSSIFIPFSASAVCFLFHPFHMEKMFPLEDFFHLGKHKKVSWGEMQWLGQVGHRGHVIFGQNLLNIQHGVGRCTSKSTIMKWANVLKESLKKFSEAECSLSQQCQLVHWYRWVPTTLT